MITFGQNLTNQILSLINDDSFVVTDENVFRLYPQFFQTKNLFVMPSGEDSKSLLMLEKICQKMLQSGLNRKSLAIAIGGGVVGDITGFASAIYMRGINWISVPTTLLALVDSGVGGKTAVNLDGYKNIIGAFCQPQSIYISSHFIKTLPDRERLCGIGEIIKTAFLDEEIFDYVESNLDKLINFDYEFLDKLIIKCVKFKDKIVTKDEKESGLRKILNLGHTIGHAYERLDNHQKSHGEYVLCGMLIENFICRDYIDADYYDKMQGILLRLLSQRMPKIDALGFAKNAVLDKKNFKNGISIIAAVKKGEQREVFFEYEQLCKELNKCEKKFCL